MSALKEKTHDMLNFIWNKKKKTLNQSLKYLQMYAVPAQSTSGQSFYCNTNMNQDHEYLHVNCRDLDRTHNSRGANNCPTCWATPPSPPNNKMIKGRIKKTKKKHNCLTWMMVFIWEGETNLKNPEVMIEGGTKALLIRPFFPLILCMTKQFATGMWRVLLYHLRFR